VRRVTPHERAIKAMEVNFRAFVRRNTPWAPASWVLVWGIVFVATWSWWYDFLPNSSGDWWIPPIASSLAFLHLVTRRGITWRERDREVRLRWDKEPTMHAAVIGLLVIVLTVAKFTFDLSSVVVVIAIPLIITGVFVFLEEPIFVLPAAILHWLWRKASALRKAHRS
jgi:hypothetical protein